MIKSFFAHSSESRMKIGVALREVWRKRHETKRRQENLCVVWSNSIAEAAKAGGTGETVLDWDSYDRIKAEMLSDGIKLKADQAKAKYIGKMKTERSMVASGNDAEVLDLPEAKQLQASISQASAHKKTGKACSGCSKLRRRLTKFHRRVKHLKTLLGLQMEEITGSEAQKSAT